MYPQSPPRKQFRGKCKKVLEATKCSTAVEDYFQNSSLHGLRYIGSKNLSLCERAFFAIAVIIVGTQSILFGLAIWQKWDSTPIIMTINAHSTTASHIPFPAITICNMNQARENIARNLSDNSVDKTLLNSICAKDGQINVTKSTNFTGKWWKIRQFLIDVSQPCEQMLLSCSFGARSFKCSELFSTVLTDEGLCCIFNSVHPRFLLREYDSYEDIFTVSENKRLQPFDWEPERGYGDIPITEQIYPRRSRGTGARMGLSVALDARVEDYYCSSTSSAGFKVIISSQYPTKLTLSPQILLHPPIEMPKISEYGSTLAIGEESRLVINPKIVDATQAVRRVPKNRRQCVFPEEANLTYFRHYTLKNCQMECESRLMYQACQCVMYYLPRIPPNVSICDRRDVVCYNRVRKNIQVAVNDSYDCNCWPACFGISYSTETSHSHISLDNFIIQDPEIMKLNRRYVRHNVSIVHIHYDTNIFRSVTRDEFIGLTEFICNSLKEILKEKLPKKLTFFQTSASIGGILGLCMGFSVVSLVEIVYFALIRPCFEYRRSVKLQKRGFRKRSMYQKNIHPFVSTIECQSTNRTEFRQKNSSKKSRAAVKKLIASRNDINQSRFPYVD